MSKPVFYRAEAHLIEVAVAMARFRAAWPGATAGGDRLRGITDEPESMTYWSYFEPLPTIEVQFHMGVYQRQEDRDKFAGGRMSSGMIKITAAEPWIVDLLKRQMNLRELIWKRFGADGKEL